MIRLVAGLLLVLASGIAPAQSAKPAMQLWRLDCGNFVMKRFGAWFSDTFQYPPGPKDTAASCYLTPPASRSMLWDTAPTAAPTASPPKYCRETVALTTTASPVTRSASSRRRPARARTPIVSRYPGSTVRCGPPTFAPVSAVGKPKLPFPSNPS